MGREIVIALYRAREGGEETLRRLLADHLPTLRRRGLATEREGLLMRASDGTYLEVFEWASADASVRAHEDPEVAPLWHAMGEVAEFPALGDLAESARRFPHFRPVDAGT